MSAPEVKGWCPGAYRPMMSADGLVVRVRPPLGELTSHQVKGLADLAQSFGSGFVEVTSRANLQVRGVKADHHAEALAALDALDLLSATPDSEARSNVILHPFGDRDDGARIARALLDGLREAEFATLPGKFGFVVDIGAERQLSDISGDIRVETTRDGSGVIVRADGCPTGRRVSSDRAAGVALDLVRWFIDSGGVGPDGRGRMARHLATGANLPDSLGGDAVPAGSATAALPGSALGGICVAAAFGQFSAAALTHLASRAPMIRVSPHRLLFLPGVSHLAEHPELVLRPDDPLRRVQACTGAPGCPQASVETRRLARALAPQVPDGQTWHVSGCSKGCVWPKPANVTLVGQSGVFDLVTDGAPWDDPARRGLSAADVLTDLRP